MNVIDLSSLKFAAANVAHCKDELKKLRWSEGFVCPACGHDKAYQLRSRNQLECANKSCKRQTSPTAGTQFHNTRLCSLESFWAMLSKYQNNLAALTKTKIEALMNVSASTARRIVKIISSSFKSAINAKSSSDAQRTEEKKDLWLENRKGESGLLPVWDCQKMSMTDEGSEPRIILLVHLLNGIELRRKGLFLFSRLHI